MKILFVIVCLYIPQILLANELTRANRWETSVKGCLENMKNADPQIETKAPVNLICACMATDLINKCAPLDSTSDDEATQCIKVQSYVLKSIAKKCQTEMPLKL